MNRTRNLTGAAIVAAGLAIAAPASAHVPVVSPTCTGITIRLRDYVGERNLVAITVDGRTSRFAYRQDFTKALDWNPAQAHAWRVTVDSTDDLHEIDLNGIHAPCPTPTTAPPSSTSTAPPSATTTSVPSPSTTVGEPQPSQPPAPTSNSSTTMPDAPPPAPPAPSGRSATPSAPPTTPAAAELPATGTTGTLAIVAGAFVLSGLAAMAIGRRLRGR